MYYMNTFLVLGGCDSVIYAFYLISQEMQRVIPLQLGWLVGIGIHLPLILSVICLYTVIGDNCS